MGFLAPRVQTRKFSKNEEKRKTWMSLLGIKDMPGTNAVLCSNHFEKDGKKYLTPERLPKVVSLLESERKRNTHPEELGGSDFSTPEKRRRNLDLIKALAIQNS